MSTYRPATYVRFERGRDWLSRLASFVSGSYYTHVDLVLSIDPPEYLGAIPGRGVVLHQDTDGAEAVCWVKLPAPVPFERWFPELGKPYDWLAFIRALLLPYPNRFALDSKRWYCTELVAYLAEATGVPTFRGIITPDSLLNWLQSQVESPSS